MTLDLIGETGLDLGGLINFEEFSYCEQCSRRKRELAAVNNELLDLNITLATVKGTQKKKIKEFKALAGKRDNFIATTCTTPGACQQLKDEIRTLRSYLVQARNIASLQQEQLSRGYKVHSKAADLTRKSLTACKALSLAKKDLELARENVEECKIHYNSLEQLKKQLLSLVKEQEQSIKELQETTRNQQKELKETNKVHKLHQRRYLETVEILKNNDKLPSRLVRWIKEVEAAVNTSSLLAVEEVKSDTELDESGSFPSDSVPSPAESRVRPFSTDSGIAPSPSDSGVGIDDNSEPSTPQPASTDNRGLCCDYGLKPKSKMSIDTGFNDLEMTPSSLVESDRKETLVDYSSNTVDNMSDSDDDDEFISINERIPPNGSSYSSGSVESPQSLESDEVNALVLTHLSKPLEKQPLLEPELEYCETNALMSIHPDDTLSHNPSGRDPLSESDILDIDNEFVNMLSPVDELTKPWTEEVHASELNELPRLPNISESTHTFESSLSERDTSETEVVSNLDAWPTEDLLISSHLSLEQAFETHNQPPLTGSEPTTEEPASEDENMSNPLETLASSEQTAFIAPSMSTLTPMGIPSLTFLPDMTAPLEETHMSGVLQAPELEDLALEHSRPDLIDPSKEDIYFSQKMCEFPKEDIFPPQKKTSGLPKKDIFSPQKMSDLPKENVYSPQKMSVLPKEDVFTPQKMSGLLKEDVYSPQKMSGLPKEDVYSPQKMSGLPKEDVFSPQKMSDLPIEDVFSPQKMSDLPKEDVFSPQKMSGLPKEDVFSPQKMSDLPKEDVFSPQKMSGLPKEDVFFPQKMSDLPKEDIFSPQKMSDLPKEDVFSPQKMSGLPKEDVFSPQKMSDLPKKDIFSPQKMSGLPKENVYSPQKMSGLPKEDVFTPQKMSGLPKEDVYSPQKMSDLPKEDVYSPQKMSGLPKEDVFSPQKMSGLPKEDVFSPQKMSGLPKEDVYSPQKMSGLPKENVFSPQKMSGLPKEDVYSPQKMSDLPKEDVFSPQKMSGLPKEDVFSPQKMSDLPKEDVFSPQKMSDLPKEDVFSPQKMSGLPKEDVYSPQKMSDLPKEDVYSPQKMSDLPKEDVFSPQKRSDLPKEDVFSPQKMSGLPKEDVFSPQKMSDLPKEDVFSPQKMSELPKEDVFSPQKMSGLSKEDVYSPQKISDLPKENVYSPKKMSDLPKEDVFSPQKMSGLPKEDVFSPHKMSGLPAKTNINPTLPPTEPLSLNKVKSDAEIQAMKHSGMFFFGQPIHKEFLENEETIRKPDSTDLHKNYLELENKIQKLQLANKNILKRMDQKFKKYSIARKRFNNKLMSHLMHTTISKGICFGFNRKKFTVKKKKSMKHSQREAKGFKCRLKKVSNVKELLLDNTHYNERPLADNSKILESTENINTSLVLDKDLSLNIDSSSIYDEFEAKTKDADKIKIKSDGRSTVLFENNLISSSLVENDSIVHLTINDYESKVPDQETRQIKNTHVDYSPERNNESAPMSVKANIPNTIMTVKFNPTACETKHLKQSPNVQQCPSTKVNNSPEKDKISKTMLTKTLDLVSPYLDHNETSTNQQSLDHNSITSKKTNATKISVQFTPESVHRKEISNLLSATPRLTRSAVARINVSPGVTVASEVTTNFNKKSPCRSDGKNTTPISNNFKKKDINMDVIGRSGLKKLFPLMGKSSNTKKRRRKRVRTISKSTSLQINSLNNNLVPNLSEKTHELNKDITPIQLNVGHALMNKALQGTPNLSAEKQVSIEVREEPVNYMVHNNGNAIPLKTQDSKIIFEKYRENDLKTNEFTAKQEMCITKDLLKQHKTEDLPFSNIGTKKCPSQTKTKSLQMKGAQQIQPVPQCTSLQSDITDNVVEMLIPIENTLELNESVTPSKFEVEDEIPNETVLEPLNLSVKKQYKVDDGMNESKQIPLNLSEKQFAVEICKQPPDLKSKDLNVQSFKEIKEIHTPQNSLEELGTESEVELFNRIDKKSLTEVELLLKDLERDSFVSKKDNDLNIHEFKEDKVENQTDLVENMTLFNNGEEKPFIEYENSFIENENRLKPFAETSSYINEKSHLNIEGVPPKPLNVYKAPTIKMRKPLLIPLVDKTLKEGKMRLTEDWLEDAKISCISTNHLTTIPIKHEPDIGKLDKEFVSFTYGSQQTSPVFKTEHDSPMSFGTICDTDSKVNLKGEFVSIEVKKENYGKEIVNQKSVKDEDNNVLQIEKSGHEENIVAQNLKPGYEENINVAQNLKPGYEENVNVAQNLKPGYEANVNAPQIVKPKYKENSYALQNNTLKIKTEVLDDFDQKTNISTKIKSEISKTIGMPRIQNYTKVKPKIEVVDHPSDIKKVDAASDIYLIPNAKPKRIAHQVKNEKQELGDFQNDLDLSLKKEPSRELGRSEGKSQMVTLSRKSDSKIRHSSGNTRLSVTKRPISCSLVSNKDEVQVMTSISDEKTNFTKNMISRKKRILESRSLPPKKPISSSLFSNKNEAQAMTSISDEKTNFTKNMISRKRRILESKSLPPKKRISSSLVSNKDEAQVMSSISNEQTNFTKNMTPRKRRTVESNSVPPKRIRKKIVEDDSTGPGISVPTRKSGTQLDSAEPHVRNVELPEPVELSEPHVRKVELPELVELSEPVQLSELPPQIALGSKNKEYLYSESLDQSTSKTVALHRPRDYQMSGNQLSTHSFYTSEKYERFAGSPAPYLNENIRPYHSMVQNVINMGTATSTGNTATPYFYPAKNYFKHPHPCNKHSSESVLFRDDLNEPDDPNLKSFSNKKPKFWHNVKDVTHFLSHTFRNFWRKNFKKKMFSKAYQEEIDSMAHQKDLVPDILKQYLDEGISLEDAIDRLVPRKFFTESHMISVNIIIEITRRSTEKAELPNYSKDNFHKKSYFEDRLLVLVAGLVRADDRFRYLPQQLYDRVQLRLFRLHHTPSGYSVYSLTRFCVQLCLWQAKLNGGSHSQVWHGYISLFCYDALYCLNYSAIAVIYVTIHLYENILERVKEGKVDSIWSVVMAHVVLSQNNSKSNHIYKLEETKKLVESYGYKRGGIMVHHITNYLLHKLERGMIKDIEACFLIIAKKNSWGWVYDNIVRKLLNLIDRWMKGEGKIKDDACMVAIRTVSFICRSFDKKAKHMLEEVFKKIAEVLDASPSKLSPIDMRCVVESLVVLKRHISPKLFIPAIIKVPDFVHVHYTTVSQLYSNMKGTAWEGFSWGDVLSTIPASTSVIHGSKTPKKNSFNDSHNSSAESLNLPSTSTSSSLFTEPNSESIHHQKRKKKKTSK